MSLLPPAISDCRSISSELPQFALTKTVAPPVGKLAVERQRLLYALEQFASRKLILVKAPAGYGKTTLAAAWCNRQRLLGALVAWLSLDSDDNEPGTFAYHLAKAVERASPEIAGDALDLLRVSSLIPPQNVVSALLNAAAESESEVYVLIDDFHVVRDRRCHDLIAFLLRYAPSNLHLVILTRTEPGLQLSRLRLEDGIGEIDASQLRFNLSETREFLGSELCDCLKGAGISRLYTATEGWPAALQLARIALRSAADPNARLQTFTGATHKISEYLEDTLGALPDEIVLFLLQSSILEHLNGSLCEAVTGVPQSSVLLDRLERQQLLLIPLDEEGRWYRYHHLMREFLHKRLQERLSGDVAGLHRRAYAWYAGHAQWTQAVQHAIAAGDFDRALSFVSQCAMSLVIKGDLLTLLAWERQLPAELMGGQLEVKLALAWGMALVTRFKEADRLLAQVEKAAETSPASDLWWRCKAARAITCALADDSARARDLASECLQDGHKFDPFNFNALCNVTRYDLMKAGDWPAFDAVAKPDLADGEASYVLPENYRLCLSGMGAAQRLRCDEALELYAGARSLAEKYVGPKSVASTMVTGLAARVQYERGDTSGAEIAVLDTLELLESTAFHEGFLQAFLVIVRAAVARGDHQRALGLLNRAERLSWERGWGRVVAALLVERTRLHLQARNTQEAMLLLQAFEQLKSSFPPARVSSWSEIETYYTIAQGLIAGATGHVDDAVALLQQAHESLLSTDNRLDALRIGVDLALAQHHAGQTGAAAARIAELFEQAASAGLKTFLLERKDEIAALLAFSVDRAPHRSERQRTLVRSLLSDLHANEPESGAGASAAQRLTDREQSIVGFIAVGHSNKEIARELGVAPETIKTHLKRIFHKLSAETRAQAVVRAQSLGMLASANRQIVPHLLESTKRASPSAAC